jgi:hypothetical protein
VEKKNASDFPKYYYTRHMQAGLCGYDDETILVDTETVSKLSASFKGKPVYIEHQDVKLDSLKEDAVGYVQETFMGVDGWLWSEIMVTDDEAHEVINKGWAVSNAYIPTVWGDGGTKNNLPYDREVLDGEFTHLALVPNPRYEGAKIYTPEQYRERNTQLVNSLAHSKPTEEKKGILMKFFKTNKEEVSNASEADTLEYVNSKGETVEVSVQEMVNALEADAKLEQKVKVNGKEMTLAELSKAYEKLNAKKNEDEEDKENEDEEKENEEEEDTKSNRSKKNRKRNESEEDKENEDDDEYDNEDDEKENEDEEEKKNSNFKKMKNAHIQNSSAIPLETTMSKLQRGSALYGSGK